MDLIASSLAQGSMKSHVVSPSCRTTERLEFVMRKVQNWKMCSIVDVKSPTPSGSAHQFYNSRRSLPEPVLLVLPKETVDLGPRVSCFQIAESQNSLSVGSALFHVTGRLQKQIPEDQEKCFALALTSQLAIARPR